jgi:hypothetical protein
MTERFSGSSPSNVLVSGGAGNCKLCVSDCVAGQTFKTFQGHTGSNLFHPFINKYIINEKYALCQLQFWD